MKKTIFFLLLTIGIIAAAKQPAQAQDATQRRGPLSSVISDSAAIEQAALGTWHYRLVSDDLDLGRLTMTVTKEDLADGPCYRFEQSGEFITGDKESRRIKSVARMRPNLTLIDFEKSEEIVKDGKTSPGEKMQATVGALAISVKKESPGKKPVETTISKPGALYYAPGTAWLALHIISLEQGQTYVFDAYVPDEGKVFQSLINVIGNVSRKGPDGSPAQFMRVSVFNGLDEMLFHIGGSGNVLEYGPATGEMQFILIPE